MHPPRVRAGRAPEPSEIIVVVQEVVVAAWVSAEFRIVSIRAQCEWRAALPAADHLRPEQFLFLWARGIGAEILPIRRHAGMKLQEDDVGAVATEHLGLRHRRQPARFVGIAEDEFAGLDRRLLGVGARNAAAFDCGLTDPILEPEWVSARWKLVTVLTPDHTDARQFGIGLARPFGTIWSRSASGDRAAKPTWTSGDPSGFSQLAGLFSPTSPSSAARAAIPC